MLQLNLTNRKHAKIWHAGDSSMNEKAIEKAIKLELSMQIAEKVGFARKTILS